MAELGAPGAAERPSTLLTVDDLSRHHPKSLSAMHDAYLSVSVGFTPALWSSRGIYFDRLKSNGLTKLARTLQTDERQLARFRRPAISAGITGDREYEDA